MFDEGRRGSNHREFEASCKEGKTTPPRSVPLCSRRSAPLSSSLVTLSHLSPLPPRTFSPLPTHSWTLMEIKLPPRRTPGCRPGLKLNAPQPGSTATPPRCHGGEM